MTNSNTQTPSIYLTPVQAAKALKAELKAAFPQFKFYAKSKTFSMGNSVEAAVKGEATEEQRVEIRNIARKYETWKSDQTRNFFLNEDGVKVYGAKYVNIQFLDNIVELQPKSNMVQFPTQEAPAEAPAEPELDSEVVEYIEEATTPSSPCVEFNFEMVALIKYYQELSNVRLGDASVEQFQDLVQLERAILDKTATTASEVLKLYLSL